MNTQRSGRPPVGTPLLLRGIGPVRVASNQDPSLLVLETMQGVAFRIGERALPALVEHGHDQAA
ncbi:MAG: hypothetical protein U5K43_06695 [Halofilum sp. (in: g-proteobacteria)]|nr:hypothetical protein [Halofilum sp. (in: g-proteobacteria)]